MINDLKTKVLDLSNPLNLGTEENIIKVEGKGFVEEIKFTSSTSTTDNKSYKVRIQCDNNTIYDDSWDNFVIRALYEEGITAFEDTINSKYILFFRNFFYTKNFLIRLYNSSAAFSHIFVKYHKEIKNE